MDYSLEQNLFMKYLLTFFFATFFFSNIYAQPANDDCAGIIDLGEAPICPAPSIYSNMDATASDIGMDNEPPCFGIVPETDVWFSFVATAAILNYEISAIGVGGTPIMQPQIALYRGDCGFDQLVLLDCVSSSFGDTETTLNVSGLTPGITYFIRINNWTATANPEWGDFELCVQELVQTEFTVDQTGSDQCSGTLYDTGGESGNYGFNENHVFSICPPNPENCIVFSLSQYNIGLGGDNLIFYDGPDVNSPVLGAMQDGFILSNDNSIGGVCSEFVATSGCLTVQFISDGFESFEGFAGTWECVEECPESGELDISTGPDFTAIQEAMDNPFFDITVVNVNCSDESYGTFQQGDGTTFGHGRWPAFDNRQCSRSEQPRQFSCR